MTDKPKGDRDRHGPGDAERAQAASIPHKNAAMGTLLVTVEEQPGKRPVCGA